MAMKCVYQTTRRKRPTLIAGLILATDGWFSYTSLLVKLDTSAIFIGLLGVWLLYVGLQSEATARQRWYQILGGAVIGLAATYKHVAVVFVVALAFHGLYYRFWLHKPSFHRAAFVASVLVCIAYVIVMIATVGSDYTNATMQQVNRVIGIRSSPGLNPSLGTALRVLVDTYVAFLGSVGISIFGGALAFSTVGTAIIGMVLSRLPLRKEKRKNGEKRNNSQQREESPYSFFIALSLCAIGFLFVIQLRNPHYLGYGEVPISIVVAGWLDLAMDYKISKGFLSSSVMAKIAYILLAVILLLNVRTLSIRIFDFGSKTDVLMMAKEVILERIPPGSRIVSVQSVCKSIAQEDYICIEFKDVIHQGEIDRFAPDAVIEYDTPTTHRQQSDAMSHLLSLPGPEDILSTFTGWKNDTVTVVWVNPNKKPNN